MTPRQFSALTGIKYEMVIDWIKAGKLEAIPVGKRYLITESEYRRYMSRGLRFHLEDAKFARRKRQTDIAAKEEVARLTQLNQLAQTPGSAEGPKIEGLDDESEFNE